MSVDVPSLLQYASSRSSLKHTEVQHTKAQDKASPILSTGDVPHLMGTLRRYMSCSCVIVSLLHHADIWCFSFMVQSVTHEVDLIHQFDLSI